MSEFGIKIKNIQAASIYEYQYGFRDKLDTSDAMLVNSLFKDFLVDNGLNIYKEESTRDIICIEFGYGTRTADEMIKKLTELANNTQSENGKEHLNTTIDTIKKNADKCAVRISRQDLRTMYYKNGVTIGYKSFNKDGSIKSIDNIHYKMLYRTAGKAKKGTCMFIREELYDKAHNFLYMGLELPSENAPIVEIGVYSSLITSSIVGKVQIKPEQMLVVKDIETFFNTKVIAVRTNEKKECYVENRDSYDLVSNSFDGQALIDSSIFPPWADGYVLLRHHMMKAAAFSTNIQLFMKDYFGDEYETATVTDMWGNKLLAKDIKFITTDTAMKWLKFKVSYEYWLDKISYNDYYFGIVKTAHPSKLGDVQRMSYQMVNALDINTMAQVTEKSVEYIEKLKSDDKFFLEYLKKNINFSNDYDVLIDLAEHNCDFIYSSYFRERKKAIIKAYVLDFKSGRTIQNADNLTIVGSPYAQLLHSVGDDYNKDPTFKLENDSIQCWTNRFADGEYLAEFRSPFNSRNNLGYIHNTYHPYFDKYFNLGKLCVAVNTVGTDFQSRNNGSDQDSDSIYTTNQPAIVEHARYCYKNYATVVNEISPEKLKYTNTPESFARVDNELMKAQLAIGQSSNLAQLALTYTYNFDDIKYYNFACILAVLAQVAIDNAKRKFDIELDKEIRRIKSEMDVKYNKLPKFWEITKKDKRKARTDKERQARDYINRQKIKKEINENLVCPMNYIYDLDFNKFRSEVKTLPMSEFFINHKTDNDRRKSRKVEELIRRYSFSVYEFNINDSADEDKKVDYIILHEEFDKIVNDIRNIYISKNYQGMMSWIINRAFFISPKVIEQMDYMNEKQMIKNRALLIKILYSVDKNTFLSCFVEKKCTPEQNEELKNIAFSDRN